MKSRPAFAVHFRLMAVMLAGSVGASQTAFAAGAQLAAVAGPSSASRTITVPQGTVVPLTLVSPIKSRSTKVGDTVRAQVAFPITVGALVAIPAATYVEGTVTSLTAQSKQTHQPDVQIHFTRLVYANGYAVPLDAVNTQASKDAPDLLAPAVGSGFGAGSNRTVFFGGEGFASRAQTSEPTTPTLPQVGPSKGLIFGITGGVLAALLTLGFALKHHTGNADYVLFDAGWQLQMTISTPLAVDAGQATAAAGVHTAS